MLSKKTSCSRDPGKESSQKSWFEFEAILFKYNLSIGPSTIIM